MRNPIAKTPSPLALAIRANRDAVVSLQDSHRHGLSFVEAINRMPPAYEVAGRFVTMDGLTPADWLECREIERQMG